MDTMDVGRAPPPNTVLVDGELRCLPNKHNLDWDVANGCESNYSCAESVSVPHSTCALCLSSSHCAKLAGCEPGWQDLDGQARNGCETKPNASVHAFRCRMQSGTSVTTGGVKTSDNYLGVNIFVAFVVTRTHCHINTSRIIICNWNTDPPRS